MAQTPIKHRIRIDPVASDIHKNSPYANPQSPIAAKARTPSRKTKASPSPGPGSKRLATFSPHKLSPNSRKEGCEIANGMFSPAGWRKSGVGSARRSKEPSADLEFTKTIHEEEFLEAYVFMKHLPALPKKYQNRTARLPPKAKDAPKHTLVLDLDETLVHCSVEPVKEYDLIFPVRFNGVTYRIYMRRRPHVREFLREVSKHFEVICFTASQQVYGDKVLNIIDPDRRYISHRLFRDSCVNTEGNFLKELSVLGRDLKYTMLVDNSPSAFSYQIDNGIPIISWFDDNEDTELLKLLPLLMETVKTDDVPAYLRRKFALRDVIAQTADDAFLVE